ncbi:hypothetical protein FN846DRAFT_909448 [Sphaerosporella brunnea]|uniref:Uncharacterized protein n=1 Tax=Sphaerosporella brunnea TaxID=1250544 RepID=A0A5J5ERW6_9PEZI|nr:hypothetical protein FN846DRAFT_909448 [Sphaerosporella brunnea]
MLHQTIRHYSQNAMKKTRSPQAIIVYSYMVAGFTLPFAGPVASKIRGGDDKQASSNMSLHHCCR